MHVDMSATQRRTKRRVAVHVVKIFGEQLFFAARFAHDNGSFTRPDWWGRLGSRFEAIVSDSDSDFDF